MEAREAGRSVYDVAAGEHCSLTADSLAMTITTMTVVFGGRHFFGGLPQLRFLRFRWGLRGSSSDVWRDWKSAVIEGYIAVIAGGSRRVVQQDQR